MGDPCEAKRRILGCVAESILLYAAAIWVSVLENNKYITVASRVQRRVALRICRGYRTISNEAARVLARIIPIDLLVEERSRAIGMTAGEKKALRKETVQKWQNRWNASDKDVWLHKLLPDITRWYERSCGEIGYYLTQTMTAHGSFQSYVRRIGKAEHDPCLYCSSEIDNAEHTIFRCPAWADIRNLSEITVRAELRPENIVQIMMEVDFKWKAVESMVEKILKRKEQDSRQRGPNTQQH
ncbi:uncharacterized protein LOC130443352 [Diorhabda sublineata]|uniref:uncharacterized protein LOC130443352 n=1 Tax=Diorhabda sublineata TaxID=1163346 RepID=UPI0024E12F26|nr:uncharacterized protein LOC130443352 [Diorhabda sublineata]